MCLLYTFLGLARCVRGRSSAAAARVRQCSVARHECRPHASMFPAQALVAAAAALLVAAHAGPLYHRRRHRHANPTVDDPSDICEGFTALYTILLPFLLNLYRFRSDFVI